jgi:hypothetical protein
MHGTLKGENKLWHYKKLAIPGSRSNVPGLHGSLLIDLSERVQ